MEQLTIHIKDASKRTFLLELLRQFEFVELQIKAQQPIVKKAESYDFFASAGLFKKRNIDAQQLRKQAWRIQR